MVLLESKELFVNQSAFTGESVPVEKIAGKAAVENGMENYGCNYS